MTGILKRTAKLAGGTLIVLALTGMAAHHLIPHRDVPAASEFGLGPRTSATGLYRATIETDANDDLVAVRDFGSGGEGPVDFERHPGNGDIYFVAIFTNSVYRIRYTGAQ